MSRPKLIGLTGLAGCGKDTIAEFLKVEGYVNFAFANPLKRACAALLDIPLSEFNDRILKERKIEHFGISPRRTAQLLGTEFARDMLHPNFWIIRLEHDKTFQNHIFKVVTDVRFDNEADWIRSKGGEIWHVKRDEVKPVEPHSSEAGVRFTHADKNFDNNNPIRHIPRTIRQLLDDT